MKLVHAAVCLSVTIVLLFCGVSSQAQSSAAASSIPQIIQFSGQFSGQSTETPGGAAVPSGTVSITFTLYEDEQGGTALWSETQNVQVDAQGHYTALLGSTSSEGLPMNLFTTVQAHWLAVQPVGQGLAEQPRVLLVSAPYALKAGDAETIGGLPPSAFVRVDASSGESGTTAGTAAGISAGTSGGTTTVATTTQASKGSAPAKPKTPSTTECGAFCDAATGYQIEGLTVLAAPGEDNIALGVGALVSNTTGGFNTASGDFELVFNTTGSENTASGAYVLQNNTTGSYNTASGAFALYSNNNGTNNTASGNGALYSNATGSYNTASGNGALYSNTTASSNTASGAFALYSNTSGTNNTASGANALQNNSTGSTNTASGVQALFGNTSGTNNTASGAYALYRNTTGSDNTASGYQALLGNTTGANNIAIGYDAGGSASTGSENTFVGYNAGTTQAGLSNATAIGASADVEENNALVLGSINGVNGATANTMVGIGTTTPAATLDVNGTANMRGLVTFAAGQTFPGTGTITGVTAGADLTGGGTSGSVTLNLDTTKVPTLGATSNVFTGSITASSFTGNGAAVTNVNAALLDGLASSAFQPAGSYATLGANTFSGNQNITGNLTGSGTVTGAVVNATTSFDLGGTAFAFGSSSTDNAFLGFAGNTTTSGMSNTAAGVGALSQNTTGGTNTAIGHAALTSNTTGVNNIAIGYQAALSVTGANSNNIEIGSAGTSTDSGTIRIGTKGTQKKFFVAGVEGVTVGSAVPVMIDSATGQLGTVSSSRRFKEDIHDMGDASEGLMRLRPVTFRYKQPLDDGSKPIQYGLIAEEVAEVYPDLVARSADGQIETVKYQVLDPMLLNEVQRQQGEIRDQQTEIRELQEGLKKMEAALASMSRGPQTP